MFNKQRGASTVVKAWEEFDAAQQARILEGVLLDPGEFPIIGCADERTCLTITQQRIVWRLDSTPYSLDLDKIVRVKVPEFFESSKHDLRRLWIVTSDGTEHPVEVEFGEPFFVLWHLLLHLVPGGTQVGFRPIVTALHFVASINRSPTFKSVLIELLIRSRGLLTSRIAVAGA